MAPLIRFPFLLAFAVWPSLAHAQGQQPRYQPGWPCSGTVSQTHVSTAEATGGAVMLFTPAEIAGSLPATMKGSSRHREVLFRATGRVAEGLHEFDVPIDSSVESAYFFISLQCLDAISIVGPSGEEVNPAAPGMEHHAFTAVRLLTVPTPEPGMYRLRLAGRGFFSVIVRGQTELQLANVTFAAGGFPIKREAQRLEVALRGAPREISFQTISATAGPLESVTLELTAEEDGERTYAGSITPPARDFRLAVTGTDERGFRFQRVEEKLHVK